MVRTIDLNCDMGEAFGIYQFGADLDIIKSISSANIACGWHAGDPLVMDARVKLCKEHGVAVGAHPGFPDLMGFGRRNMQCSPAETRAYVLYQLGALHAFVQSHGLKLRHVKAHGNLYNMAAVDITMATAIAEAVASFDSTLVFVGLAGSHLCAAGKAAGLRVASEVFADRAYQADGNLVPRGQPGAVFHEVDQAVQRIVQLVEQGTLTAYDGSIIEVQGDTICLHGDTPGAADYACAVREQLENRGIAICAMGSPS